MDQYTSGTGIRRDFAPPRRIMSQSDLSFSREIGNVPADKALGLLSAFSKGRNMTELAHRKTSSMPNYHTRSLRGPPKTPKHKSLAVVPEGDEAEDFNFNFADLRPSENANRRSAPPLQLSETPTQKSSIAKPTKTIPKPSSPDKKRTELPTPTSTPTPAPTLAIPKRVSMPILGEPQQLQQQQNQQQQSYHQQQQIHDCHHPQVVASPLRRKANTKEPLRAHAARRIPSTGIRQTPSLRALKPEPAPVTPSPTAKKHLTPTPSPLTRRSTTSGVVVPKGHQRSSTAPSIEVQQQQQQEEEQQQQDQYKQKQRKQQGPKQPKHREEKDNSPRAPPLSSKISRNAIVHAYYTILRDRHPGHYLVNLSEEEEDILSQKQYAELLQLACQRVRSEDVAHSGGETGEEDRDDEDEDEDDDDDDDDGDDNIDDSDDGLDEDEDRRGAVREHEEEEDDDEQF